MDIFPGFSSLLAAEISVAAVGALLVKSTLLLTLAAGAVVLFRGASAAVRHLVWSLALAGLLVLPVLSSLLPTWSLASLPWPQVSIVTPSGPPAPLPTVGEPRLETEFEGADESEAPPAMDALAGPVYGTPPLHVEGAAPRDAAAWLLGLWLAGFLLVLGWLAMGQWGVHRMVCRGEPITDADWNEMLRDLAWMLEIDRPVRLLRSGQQTMPLTYGIVRPVVLLPSEAEGWPEERKRAVLLHELAHVRRFDCLTQTLAQLACALFWLHPGVWYAARRLRVERERACDDLVLSLGTRASDYAGCLLEMARSFRHLGPSAPAAVSMARPSQLEGRLLAVLDPARSRRTPGRLARTGGLLAVLLIVCPLAAMMPAALPAPEDPMLLAAEEAMHFAADELPGATPVDTESSWASHSTSSLQDFRWTGRLRPGATLAVYNISGEIKAQPATGEVAEVTAVTRLRRGDPADVRIETVEHASGVTLCVFHEGSGVQNRCTPRGVQRTGSGSAQTQANTDFLLLVPAQVELRAVTMNGSIAASGLYSDADVTTMNGSINVRSGGAVAATTMNGSIDVAMGRTEWDGTLALKTMNGAIRVELPTNASTDVRARTMSGPINSDFALDLRRRAGSANADGTIGAGGRVLDLVTMNGRIRIERQGGARAGMAPSEWHAAPAAPAAPGIPAPPRAPGGPAPPRPPEAPRDFDWEGDFVSSITDWSEDFSENVVRSVMDALNEAGVTAKAGNRSTRHARASDPERIALYAAQLREEPYADVRKVAAWALAGGGPESVAPLSHVLRNDTSAAVREMAAWSLARTRDPRGASALHHAVARDRSEEVRWSALISLSELGTDAIAPILPAAAADRSARIRKRAVWTIGDLRRAEHSALLMATATRDANAEVRQAALWAIGRIADPRAASATAQAMQDSDPEARKAALWALSRMPDAVTATSVQPALRSDDPTIRKLALQVTAGESWPWPWPWPVPRPRPTP